MEKVAALQQDLAAEGMELECMQREAMSKQEQDKVKYGRVKMVLVIFLFFFLHITLCFSMQWPSVRLSYKTCGINLRSL